jgi:hypothetical protein
VETSRLLAAMLYSSSTFKFFRAGYSERVSEVVDDIYGALNEWVVGGPARQYVVVREGRDYLVVTLRCPPGDATAAELDAAADCERWGLERITTAFLPSL